MFIWISKEIYELLSDYIRSSEHQTNAVTLFVCCTATCHYLVQPIRLSVDIDINLLQHPAIRAD